MKEKCTPKYDNIGMRAELQPSYVPGRSEDVGVIRSDAVDSAAVSLQVADRAEALDVP